MTMNEEKTTENAVSENVDVTYSDLYPERKQGSSIRYNWFGKLTFMEKKQDIERTKCELNVYSCIQDNPVVKLMMAALKSSGCEIDISRHITCEVCDRSVTGGFDVELNQIVICQNTARSKSRVLSSLVHEMIHMFDYCKHKLDLNKLEHLACTEIRAANICHCSFLNAMSQGTASLTHIKKAHRDCVKDRAIRSVLAARKVSKEEATEAVKKVFTKCYNDLEPVGRRIRKNSEDMKKAYLEAPLYGYND